MHVMVATDGTLDATKAADFAARLAGETGRVTVYSVVEVPRQLLNDLRSAAAPPTDKAGGDVQYRRTQADDAPAGSWVGDDAFVGNYVKRIVATRTASLVEALEAAGVDVEVVGAEGESASRSVLEAARTHTPDVLCVGTHGVGRFEELLGSLSTKIARIAPCPVLLIR
ncbi:MAG: universal stress protein [Ilumatobacter sp.]|nr:universal stress protein [Ilumatobacter sp.]